MVQTVADSMQMSAGQQHWLEQIEKATNTRPLPSELQTLIATLNREPFAARTKHNAATIKKLLGIHGLLVKPGNKDKAATTIPEYLVAVFQYEMIALYYRSVGVLKGGPLAVPQEVRLTAQPAANDRLLRRLARTAVRAIYALGLDYGLVRIAMAPRGAMYVLGVDPFPASPPGLITKFAAQLTTHASILAAYRTGMQQSDIVLGLDAEFVLTTSQGELVPADRYLPAAGPAGHDVAFIGRRVMRALAELRPVPSSEPRQLFANLQRAMRIAARRIDPALNWRAGGAPLTGISLGGHLHFSGLPLTFEFMRTLDNYVTLPLSLLEDTRCLARRHTFGWLGNARAKDHGGFEYRTPASMLISPVITRGVLALAKLIAVHSSQLRSRPLDSPQMQKAYFAGDKAVLSSFLDQWKREVMSLSSFANYSRELLPFIHLLEAGYVWDESKDIRKEWGIEASVLM